MDEKNGKNPLLALTVATALFAALGIMVYTPAPYKGIRPSVPEIQEAFEKVRARLWQDPFLAVLEQEKAEKTKGKGDKAKPGPDKVEANGRKAAGKKKPGKEKAGKRAPGGADTVSFIAPCEIKGTLKGEIDRRLANKEKVTVLKSMVFGGPYAEAVEFRQRQRYAILAALNRLNFYPIDAEHINYLKIAPDGKEDNQICLKNIVPYEWLTNDNSQESVLLLWLNEDSFKKAPLTKLACLRRNFPVQQKNLETIIIGPSSSSFLIEMIKELDTLEANVVESLADLKIYCATATADDPFLLGLKEDEDISEQRKHARKTIADKFFAKRIHFQRVICSDGQLMDKLMDELELRGVNLISVPGNDHAHNKKEGESGYDKYGGHRDHVVLIAEWDTAYGRYLPKAFIEDLKEKHNKRIEDKENTVNVNNITWVRRFSYLRGIDGKLPGEQNGQAREQKNDKAGNKEERDIKKLEEPVGKSQYDYLRRLAESISRLEDSLRKDNKGSIKAIGVLGNDFYDKFLVLQALGQRFPDRIFFTTDLDARFLHPANIEWTRNLVVASTFDLQLHEDHQGDVPPFRDAYQTSVFAATFHAFGTLSREKFENLQPHIFEIGRQNAVDLRDQLKDPSINSAPKPLNIISGKEIPVFVFFIIVTFILIYLCGISKKYIVYIGVLALLVGFYFAVISLFFLNKEALFVIEGISVWPSILLQIIALASSWVFIITSVINLQKNRRELQNEYFEENNTENKWEKNKKNTANSIWEKYSSKENYISKRLFWLIIFFFSLFYLFISYSLIICFGQPVLPLRGIESVTRLNIPSINVAVLFPALLSFLCLTFFVLYITRLCRCFITELLKNNPFFDRTSLNKFGIAEDLSEKSQQALSDLKLMRLVGKRTEVVGKLIFFPFIVWFLLSFSRLHYFDNYHTPLGLAIVISMSAILAWTCAFILRRSSESLRMAVITRLMKQLDRAIAGETLNKNEEERIHYVLKEVRDMKTGAFAPYLQQPVVQSLLVPLGGISGLKVLEFLATLG